MALDEAELLSICLEEAARGQGAARRLLGQHLTELAARGVGQVFLEVEAGNLPALALYRRFGFHEVGERPAYYAHADGTRARALVMRAILDESRPGRPASDEPRHGA
jgi:ribosomal-protein-alanine N-acetyltransferase